MRSSAWSSNGFSSFSKRNTRSRRTRKGAAVMLKSSRRSGQAARRTRRRCSIEVAGKLKSLRNLIPEGRSSGGGGGGGEVGEPATDRLFQETADYILRLRAQVVVLQRLIQLYGSDSSQTDAVSDSVL